jgi:hypothetical protein
MKLMKKTIVSLCLLLIATLSTTTLVMPPVTAHTPSWQIQTYAFINAAPNPVGVGQKINIIMWLDQVIDGAGVTNNIRFHDYKLVITKPDGTTETQTFSVVQDTTSAQYTSYMPTTTGNYTFFFSFPGQVFTFTENANTMFGLPGPSSYINDTYLPSNATATVTVQAEQVTAISSYPLPTDYWTRPIYGENTDWWKIASNWLGSGSPQTFTDVIADGVGSQTNHIMWTKSLQSGGVVGGDTVTVQGDTYFEGSAYINRYTNPIIMDGKLFYTEPLTFGQATGGVTNAVDLRTGELLWSEQLPAEPSFGLVFDVPPSNPNQHGVFPPILIVSTGGSGPYGAAPTEWQGYDADTGKYLFTWTNVPSGSASLGPNGEYISYVMNNAGTPLAPNYYLGEWNSTNLFYQTTGFSLSPSSTGTVDAGASVAYNYNISIAWRNTMTSSVTVIAANYGDKMICYNGTLPSSGLALTTVSDTPYTYFAVNLNASKGTVGSILWMKTYNAPANNITVFQGGYSFSEGIFLESYKQPGQWVAYSMNTGDKLWGPTASQTAITPLDYYGNEFSGATIADIAYGNVYTSEFGGVLYCFDAHTGNLKWTYGNGGEGNTTNAGYYSPRGNYPTFIATIGNGIVYLETTEHTVTTPIYKGALTRAVNATDGAELWTLSDYTGGGARGSSYIIADGFTTFFNGYDNQIYILGRGPSAMTIQAPQTQITAGDKVVIQGTVMDTAVGTTQDQQSAVFPTGVPVASDASMKDWMGYVYQQKPVPTNFTGVPVTLMALDPNNNYITLGMATTDINGIYHYTWTTPNIPGDYTVYAVFSGTNGYWGSEAVTNMVVTEAQATPTPQATQAPTMADLYFVPAIAGLFVFIAIIGVVIILVLRKRP